MAKEPFLETARLVLRPITIADADDVFSWTSDERVTKFMRYVRHESVKTVKEWIDSLESLPEDNLNWGFLLKETGNLIGSGGIVYNDKLNAWALGYNISYDYWNRGYATEAAKCMINYAYKELNARDFVCEHAVENPASGRVIEKCGLKFSNFDEYSKFDGSQTFKAKVYKMHLD